MITSFMLIYRINLKIINVWLIGYPLYWYTQRVTRPRGGINEWLHWLPISLHKKLDYLIRLIRIYSHGKKLVPLPFENGGGGSVGLASVLEADVKQIVTMARQTYEKYFLFQHLAIEIFSIYQVWIKFNETYACISFVWMILQVLFLNSIVTL